MLEDRFTARMHMINNQLMPGNILSERLIAAMAAVPREWFAPEIYQETAYVDEDIPLGYGRYMLEPLLFARLLDAANIQPGDRILDIGSATGYSTAVLAQLAGRVIGIEEESELAQKAAQNIAMAGIRNANIISSAFASGHPPLAPYDVIFIAGSIRNIPSSYAAQLAEGGRVVSIRNISQRPGSKCGLGKIVVMEKHAGKFSSRLLSDASSPVLKGFEDKPGFMF